MSTKKIAAVSATALTGLSSLTIVPAASAQSAASGSNTTCSAVDVVIAVGTGGGNSKDDPNNIYGLTLGRNYVSDIEKAYGDKVSAWQVPYTASVGVAGSLGETRADQTLPYGASRLQGTLAAQKHIEEMKKLCPSTKYVLTGFSQGATVAGDVTANLAAGKIPGVTKDDLLASYLIADPGRAALTKNAGSTSTGATGTLTENGALLIPLDQGLPVTKNVGLTGPRTSGAFSNVEGKVMTFCHNNDVACSTDPDGILREVGQKMNEWTTPSADQLNAGKGLQGVDAVDLLTSGKGKIAALTELPPFVKAVLAGDTATMKTLVNKMAENKKLTEQQKTAVYALREELAVVTDAIKNYDGVVPKYEGEDLSGSTSGLVNAILPLITIGTKDSKQVKNLIPYILNMMPHHLSYFQDSKNGPWTVGGETVDNWIYNDMNKRFEAYLEQVENAAPTTSSAPATTSTATSTTSKPATTTTPKATTSKPATTTTPKATTSKPATATTPKVTTTAPKVTTPKVTTSQPSPTNTADLQYVKSESGVQLGYADNKAVLPDNTASINYVKPKLSAGTISMTPAAKNSTATKISDMDTSTPVSSAAYQQYLTRVKAGSVTLPKTWSFTIPKAFVPEAQTPESSTTQRTAVRVLDPKTGAAVDTVEIKGNAPTGELTLTPKTGFTGSVLVTLDHTTQSMTSTSAHTNLVYVTWDSTASKPVISDMFTSQTPVTSTSNSTTQESTATSTTDADTPTSANVVTTQESTAASTTNADMPTPTSVVTTEPTTAETTNEVVTDAPAPVTTTSETPIDNESTDNSDNKGVQLPSNPGAAENADNIASPIIDKREDPSVSVDEVTEAAKEQPGATKKKSLLANTGVQALAPVALGSLAALVAGGAALFASRRRND